MRAGLESLIKIGQLFLMLIAHSRPGARARCPLNNNILRSRVSDERTVMQLLKGSLRMWSVPPPQPEAMLYFCQYTSWAPLSNLYARVRLSLLCGLTDVGLLLTN